MPSPNTVAWHYVARLIYPEDLPMAGADLLAAGYDSPSLRDLAGRSRRQDTAELDGLFVSAMDELGVRIPDDETAERCLLHHLATQLSVGSMSPRQAAARVWQGITAFTSAERAFVEAVGEEYYLDYLSPDEFRSWENTVHLAASTLAESAAPTAG